MANLLSQSSTEERIDIGFSREAEVDLRKKQSRYWRVLAGEPRAKVLGGPRDGDVDAYLLASSSLMIFENRFVMSSAKPGAALSAGLVLLWRLPEARIETLVFQRRGEGEASRDFRKCVSRLRDEAGDRLGPAVVTGETVLFYPGQVTSLKKKSLLAGGRGCVQLRMRRLSPKIEAAFRRGEPAQRRAAVSMLGLDTLMKGFATCEHHLAPSGFVIAGVKGEEYYTLHATTSGARFEFGGRIRTEVDHAMTRLLAAFAPREHAIEALHGGGEFALASAPGTHWEPQPLGQHDARFVLCASESA